MQEALSNSKRQPREPSKKVHSTPPSSSEFVAALDRGLNVLCCFGKGHERMTLSEVAERTGLSRGTARRFLLTLHSLKYVGSDGKLFWLTPKVLQFSSAYLASFGVGEAAKSVIRSVTERVGESSSMAVLDGPDIVYVAREETRRIYSSRLDVGSRLPASCTSLGRVLLAGLDDRQLDQWLLRYTLVSFTPHTITDPKKLRIKIQEARNARFAIIDGELEIGARSIAVPILDRSGRTIAALNVFSSTARVSLEKMRKVFLPVLREAAQEIGQIIEDR